jgi:hypothetical protein
MRPANTGDRVKGYRLTPAEQAGLVGADVDDHEILTRFVAEDPAGAIEVDPQLVGPFGGRHVQGGQGVPAHGAVNIETVAMLEVLDGGGQFQVEERPFARHLPKIAGAAEAGPEEGHPGIVFPLVKSGSFRDRRPTTGFGQGEIETEGLSQTGVKGSRGTSPFQQLVHLSFRDRFAQRHRDGLAGSGVGQVHGLEEIVVVPGRVSPLGIDLSEMKVVAHDEEGVGQEDVPPGHVGRPGGRRRPEDGEGRIVVVLGVETLMTHRLHRLQHLLHGGRVRPDRLFPVSAIEMEYGPGSDDPFPLEDEGSFPLQGGKMFRQVEGRIPTLLGRAGVR